jgi:flagellar biosynthesis protein
MTDFEHNKPDLAIALNYDGRNSPRITAKGSDELAQRILDLAEQHQVPLHEDPQLAALLSQVPLGDEIPEALYRAVAEVIAFAYVLTGRLPTDFKPDEEP